MRSRYVQALHSCDWVGARFGDYLPSSFPGFAENRSEYLVNLAHVMQKSRNYNSVNLAPNLKRLTNNATHFSDTPGVCKCVWVTRLDSCNRSSSSFVFSNCQFCL